MPAISNRETIPNFPLNGQELAIYAVKLLEHECELRDVLVLVSEPATRAMKQALENDWVFKQAFIYPNVNFTIALQSHVTRNHDVKTAFTLDLVFNFPNNSVYPQHKPFVRRPVSCSAPPLDGYSPDAEHVVDCFTITAKVENPNLVRVHYAMPITIAEKVQPKHGELFGEIKNHELTYDPANYESLPEPVVTDQTAQFVKAWGLEGLRGSPGTIAKLDKLQEWRETAMAMIRSDSPELDAMRKQQLAYLSDAEHRPSDTEGAFTYGSAQRMGPVGPAIHQPIDEQELVAHVDLEGAENAPERATANRGGEIDHFPELDPSDATTGAETPGMDPLGRSMVSEIAQLPIVAEFDRIASGIAETQASEADLAQKRATANLESSVAANHGNEATEASTPAETPGSGILPRHPVSKRDRKRFQ